MGSRVEISLPRNTSFDARTVTILPEMCSSELGKKPPKIYYSKWTLYPCGTDVSNIWLWIHTADVITHVKFQLDFSKDLGDTDKGRATQILVFPIAFHLRPYNSVTHYRASISVCVWAQLASRPTHFCSKIYIWIFFKIKCAAKINFMLCSSLNTNVQRIKTGFETQNIYFMYKWNEKKNTVKK